MRPWPIIMLIICLLLAPLKEKAQGENYIFTHIYSSEGLFANDVYSIIQDRRGFIWLGTGNGLYRYDGYEFKSFRKDPEDSTSISGTVIGPGELLIEDDEGTIWIGTASNGLSRFNPVSEEFTRYPWDSTDASKVSCPAITSLYQDREGTIWIGTLWGLMRYNRNEDNFKTFRRDSPDYTNWLNWVRLIYEDGDSNLWVNFPDTLLFFNQKTETFEEASSPEYSEHLEDRYIFTIYEEEDKYTWYGTDSGLFMNDHENDLWKNYCINTSGAFDANYVNQLVKDPSADGRYFWIRSGWKLHKFDRLTGDVTRFRHDPENSNSIGYLTVHDIYLDRTGLLWIAKESGGIDIVPVYSNQFRYYPLSAVPPDKKNYTATSFLKDSDGHLWVGANRAGLMHFDQSMELVDLFRADQSNPYSLKNYFVFCMYQDRYDRRWFGTFSGGLYLYDDSNERFYLCQFQNPIFGDFSLNYINQIMEDSYGTYWVVQIQGLYFLDTIVEQTPVFKTINHFELSRAPMRCIIEDHAGNLWVGSQGGGLFRMSPENRKDTLFNGYYEDAGNPYAISDNSIMSLYVDKDGELWIGTMQGLNKYIPEKDQFMSYDSRNGLNADKIFYVTGDERGYLWLSTGKGLVRFNPDENPGRMSKRYDKRDGLPFDEIYPYKIYKDPDGYIYVGGRRSSGWGFFRFHPDSLQDNQVIPPIALTGFRVRNKPFSLDTSIILKKHLILDHRDNFFSFDFAVLDYNNPVKNNYAYMLEGLDKDWIYSGNKHSVDYTNVPPGDYIFRVKGSNNDGIWNEEGRTITVTVMPPPWKTWWAYMLYGIFVMGVVFAIFWYYLKRQQLKQKLALEQVEKDKLAELDTMKSRFFANVSHEFRTPLTLILGPLDGILTRTRNKEIREDVGMIRRNALRLKRLIDQLLTLARFESNNMKLNLSETNMVELVRSYVQLFESHARKKRIRLEFITEQEGILIQADREKLEDTLYNLLSNAFKFTPEGGEVIVTVAPAPSLDLLIAPSRSLPQMGEVQGGGITISIKDTGPGIPADKLDKIFDRFFRVEERSSSSPEGTGIGLALTKELVELHGGNISVKSTPGRGTEFTVFLPGRVTQTEGREGEESGHKTLAASIPEEVLSTGETVTQTLSERDVLMKEDQPLLLVIDDNPDLRAYIRSLLKTGYHIIEASDGSTGMDEAIEHLPDLVLSDVMMPGMDGYEFCQRLKADERTCHIPVILLTARAGKEDKIEGLTTGADDFITKPFDVPELRIRISNLINQRKKLREVLRKEFAGERVPGEELPVSMDRQFLIKARTVVDEHLSDPVFTMDQFGNEMALSRVQLHRKLKALINQSATEFIREIRLVKAAELLKARSGNVTQVAYEVGFNSLSYFARCFQEKYGVKPSRYTGRTDM